MTQTIDPEKLKAAAEHLEWVLSQYPDEPAVQDLASALRPLIEAAIAQRVIAPMDAPTVPGNYNFGDGVYVPFREPHLGNAYSRFLTELQGGFTSLELELMAKVAAMRGNA